MEAGPQKICTTPLLDWGRFTTAEHETCVPFARYVQPKTTGIVGATSFLPFLRLPRELQLRVIHCCDQASLFHLMHLSSVTRYEAKKLFWSDQVTWYRVDGEWLLAGGFPGHTFNAVGFLANVQQVEIHFPSMTSFTYDWTDMEPMRLVEEPSLRTLDERIDRVWRLLSEKCPRVARVVVSEGHYRQVTQGLTDIHKRLLRRCPANLTVSASYLQHNTSSRRTVKRRLWEKSQANNSSAAGDWTVANLQWTRQIVLLPPKTFHGPVGAFQRTMYELACYLYQHRSLVPLRIEAIEKHHFGGDYCAFRCRAPACTAYFDLPGQWLAHADEYRSHCEANLPPDYEAEFAAQEEQIESRHKQRRMDVIETMRTSWSALGSEPRRIAEHAFLSQLEDDPLYAGSRPGEQTFMWKYYQATMNCEESYN
jgi:hypothetical protein